MIYRVTSAILSLLLCGVFSQAYATSQIEITQPLDSPRLVALKKDLKSGRSDALDEFWHEVAHQGAPLIEAIKGDDQEQLVTFLWRDKSKQKFVAVFPFARVNPLLHLMAQLEGTDVWYKSYKLRSDARFEYLISANDSLKPFATTDPSAEDGWLAALHPDLLNPRRFVEPKDSERLDSEEEISSVVELPGAPLQPFVAERAKVVKGHVEVIRYESSTEGHTARLGIYPAGLQSRW